MSGRGVAGRVATAASPPRASGASREASGGRTARRRPTSATAAVPLDLGFDRAALADVERATALEWLETNGLGGWASGTVSGVATRRYHGLLVAATRPPVGRRLLVAKLAETVVLADGRREELDANAFPGALHPRGFERLARFERDLFPVVELEAADGAFRLRRTVAGIDGENSVVVLYELLAAAGPVTLELRPFFAGRDVHELRRAAPGREWDLAASEDGAFRFESRAGEPPVTISAPGAGFVGDAAWWRDFELAEERRRGFDFAEDLWTPGVLGVRLEPGGSIAVVVSAEPGRRDGAASLARERARREALVAAAGSDDVERLLRLAADQFLVRRGEGWTVIAGYPWFADWGRDAMIALPGLCLSTGRFDEAKGVLRSFAAAVDRGMLPNRFPDDGEAPEYNTVDATLWFFVAGWRYLEATGDEAFLRDELLPAYDQILSWHARGTRHGIAVDVDGLLRAGEEGVQLTWMDARVDGRVITPRSGKPVEVEALWVNALRIASELHRRFGSAARAHALGRLADGATRRFRELFWNAAEGCLDDVVDGTTYDASRRPNQLFALALPWPLLRGAEARQVLAAVERDLLTPVGLRTLAPGHPEYRARYEGGPAERDGAYHQGTVWPFLLGAHLDAVLRVRGARSRRKVRTLLRDLLERHLREACVGSVSEIFDAAEPHEPRGAPAQAWSVAELLRLWRATSDGS